MINYETTINNRDNYKLDKNKKNILLIGIASSNNKQKTIINPINEMCISNATVIVITRKNNNYTYKFQDENNIRFTESCEVDEIE